MGYVEGKAFRHEDGTSRGVRGGLDWVDRGTVYASNA